MHLTRIAFRGAGAEYDEVVISVTALDCRTDDAGAGFAQPWAPIRFRVVALVSLFLLSLECAAAAHVWLRQSTATTLPSVPAIDLHAVLVDSTPLTVTIAAGGEHVEWRTTAHDIRNSPALWRRMHLANWNNVPEPLRQERLDNWP